MAWVELARAMASSLTTSDGLMLTLRNIDNVSLTGGPSGNRFNVTGFTGGATLIGGGGRDTVVASSSGDFTLSNTALVRPGGIRFAHSPPDFARPRGSVPRG